MRERVKDIQDVLTEVYCICEANALIRIMMENVTGMQYSPFFLDEYQLTSEQDAKIKQIVERLLNQEPIQHILGITEFYDLQIQVSKDVLIPRPETEELVEWIILKNKSKELSILDIGTGSGAIAIALKKHLTQAKVEAWDISAKALEIANLNAKNNNVEVIFKQVDVLSEIQLEEKYDIIVSNPPYVLEREKSQMEKNVLTFEPHLALFVPNDNPLLFYDRIASLGQELLKPKGQLYFEINRAFGEQTKTMLEEKYNYNNVELKKDISSNDRMILAYK